MRPDYFSAIKLFLGLPQDEDNRCRCLVTSVPTFTFPDDDGDDRRQHNHTTQVVGTTKSEYANSNDEVRMKAVRFEDADLEETSSANQEAQAVDSQGRVQGFGTNRVIRKTRLSIEVHPSKFFDDIPWEEEDQTKRSEVTPDNENLFSVGYLAKKVVELESLAALVEDFVDKDYGQENFVEGFQLASPVACQLGVEASNRIPRAA